MKPQVVVSKPVIAEAFPFDGTIAAAHTICRWANEPEEEDPTFSFVTMDGDKHNAHDAQLWAQGELVSVTPGDWIVKDRKGEVHLLKAEIFHEIYERAGVRATISSEELDELKKEIFEGILEVTAEDAEALAIHLLDRGWRKA